MENRRNYYRILHVQTDAPPEILTSSYRAIMRHLDVHPDRGGEHWNAALVNEAYAVLSDPVRRAAYDATLDPALFPARGSGDGADTPRSTATTVRTESTGTPRTARAEPTTAAAPHRSAGADLRCVFCGTVGAGTVGKDAVCRTCGSPLTLAAVRELEDPGRRAAQRIAREGTIRYWTDWPQPGPRRGEIVDLSPRGLRFRCAETLATPSMVKISGPLLDAVGRVAGSSEGPSGFEVGIEFATLRFRQSRGTFVSTTA